MKTIRNTRQRIGAAELMRKFNTEKEAKNRAFCRENRNTDPHAGCIFEILRMDIDRTAV